MGAQAFNTIDVVRLEVETDPTGLVNLVQNPSGDLGGWGWITPLASSSITKNIPGGGAPIYLSYIRSVAGASYFYTEPMPVAAGQYVAGSYLLVGAASCYQAARFEYLDASLAVLSSSAQTPIINVAGGVTLGPFLAPASTVYVRLRIDAYSTVGGAAPVGAHGVAFREATVAKAATAAALATTRNNLIPNPSLETNATGWLAYANSGVARSTAQAYIGTASLAVTSTGAGDAETRTLTGTDGFPVTGGAVYTAQARCRAATTGRTFSVGIAWYDSAGTQISQVGSSTTDNSAGWTQRTHTATAPAGAVTAAVTASFATGLTAGEVHYVDAVMIEAAASAGTYFDSATPDTGTIDYSAQNQTPVVTITRRNYLTNPSLETNATGWAAGTNTTVARSTTQALVGTASLSLTKTTSTGTASTTALTGTGGRPFVADRYYRVSASFRANITGRTVNVGLAIYNAAGTFLGTMASSTSDSLTWSRRVHASTSADILAAFPTAAFVGFYADALNAAVGEIHFLDAAMLEVLTATGIPDTYFDGATAAGSGPFSTITYAWTSTAHGSISTETKTLTLPFSRSVESKLSFIEPVTYLNVIAESHEIRVRRDGLNVGELSATILSTALDPSQASLIRPGRRARLTTLISGVWETVTSGKLLEADVTYELKDPNLPDAKRARIEILVLDPIQLLANTKRPQGVATIGELKYLLEGAGVPWNVNGSGNQLVSANVTTYNDGATLLNQVGLARDTKLGYAWMSRLGVFNAWDAASIPSGSPLVLTEADYSDLNVTFSTKDCINEVSVVVQSLGVDGTTVETTYGPYRDGASINEWGPFSKTFTVTGLNAAAVDALAAAVLAANGTPRVRVNSLTLPLTTLARVGAKALIDLYDQVEVINTEKALDDTLRVANIEHVIDIDAWMVKLSFADEGGVASPVFQPPVQSGARPDVGVVEMFAGPTGNIPPSKLLCNGASYAVTAYPYLFAVIGYTFGGSGANFNVPNMTDVFPIGAGSKALGTSGGAASRVLTAANLPPHAHVMTHGHTGMKVSGTSIEWQTNKNAAGAVNGFGPTAATQPVINDFTGSTGNGPGASTAVDILNPWLSLNFVIRAV